MESNSLNEPSTSEIVDLEVFTQNCSECGQPFNIGGLRVKRNRCLHCWSRGKRYRYIEELTDLYLNGSFETTIRLLLKAYKKDDWVKGFNELIGNKKISKGDKTIVVKKLYYKLRGRNEFKDRINYNRKKRNQRWMSLTYEDECVYCHSIIEFNRNENSFTCPHCEQFFIKIYHPTYEELETRRKDQ